MARIKIEKEDGVDKEKLLREGRAAIRRDMERRFRSRTPAWRAVHAARARVSSEVLLESEGQG